MLSAKEMEAFQLMSAFLVHDLKNTASALSLTLRNLPIHFENPAFREDALRTLAKSVGRVNELIGRLTTLREKLELKPAPADLNQAVTAALEAAGESPEITEMDALVAYLQMLGTLVRFADLPPDRLRQ